MLVPSRRSRLLLLLLFLACLAGKSVLCQEVMLSKVSTDRVEVAWNRTGIWFGVENFTVTVHTQHSTCTKYKSCTEESCTFNTKMCGSFLACSSNEISVSGPNTPNRTVPVQTAPGPVTALNTSLLEDVLTIRWTNPSEESSTCYSDTAVRLGYLEGPPTPVTTYHPRAEQTLTPPLCGRSKGVLQVWTRGGDGNSDFKWTTFGDDSTDDVTNALTVKTCQAVRCFGIDLAWDYTPGCPYVTHFCVDMVVGVGDHVRINCTEDTNTTSMRVTGLAEDKQHYFHIRAYGADEEEWFTADTSCYTHIAGVTNLAAVSPNTSSISASWDLPLCWPTTNTLYKVSLSMFESCSYPDHTGTTTETNYVWTDLDACTQYYVCVAVEEKTNSISVYTLPRRPAWMTMRMTYDEESVYVEWEEVNDYPYTTNYMVTWHNKSDESYSFGCIIDGYDSLEAVGKVCVATYINDEMTSNTRCSDEPGQKNNGEKNVDIPAYAYILMIVGIMLVAGAVVVVTLVCMGRQRRRQNVVHYQGGPDLGAVSPETNTRTETTQTAIPNNDYTYARQNKAFQN